MAFSTFEAYFEESSMDTFLFLAVTLSLQCVTRGGGTFPGSNVALNLPQIKNGLLTVSTAAYIVLAWCLNKHENYIIAYLPITSQARAPATGHC